MGIRGYREASRINWGNEETQGVNLAQINTGSLLRIADAVEKMAERYAELMRQRDYFENKAKHLQSIREHLERSNASLRGHLKRSKKMMKYSQKI